MYKGTLHCVHSIVKQEGWRTLYAGLTPALIGSGISWGLYFMFYNQSKARWLKYNSGLDLSTSQLIMSGLEAGSLVTLLTNPIWVLKTRLQLQKGGIIQPKTVGASVVAYQVAMASNKLKYDGILHAVQSIAKYEGVSGFYRGLGPSLILVSHAAIKFTIYEHLKSTVLTWREFQGEQAKYFDPLDATLVGGFSKVAASISTYPLQVIRSRLQQRFDVGRDLKYHNTFETLLTTLRHEGFMGLYKGLFPSLLRVVPQSSIMFLAYESALQVMDFCSSSVP